jgi:hypothetical protein
LTEAEKLGHLIEGVAPGGSGEIEASAQSSEVPHVGHGHRVKGAAAERGGGERGHRAAGFEHDGRYSSLNSPRLSPWALKQSGSDVVVPEGLSMIGLAGVPAYAQRALNVTPGYWLLTLVPAVRSSKSVV